jgi:hypothetical protein
MHFSLFALPLIAIFLIDKLAYFVRRSAGHKERVRIQRLVDTVASSSAVIIGEAIKQVAMSIGLVAAAVAGEAGKHVGDLCRGFISFAGWATKQLGRERSGQSRCHWNLSWLSRGGWGGFGLCR